jgi:asparaginyl-tRNA synthetase
METTSVDKIYRDYEQLINNNLNINGRVKTVRDSKTFGFIELNDGSYLKNIQVVFEDSLPNFADICKLGVGSAISVN